MKKLIPVILFFLAACATHPSCHAPAHLTQHAAVKGFYREYLRLHLNLGLPRPAQMQRVKPYLATRLTRMIKEARNAQAVITRRTPKGSKPDIIEGDIFTSVFEGATHIRPISDYRENGVWIVEMECSNTRPGHVPLVWRDKVWLMREKGGWRIDNVAYAGGGSLVQTLAGYIRSAKK